MRHGSDKSMESMILRLLLVVLSLDLTLTYQPYVAPFFFMCNFHGNVNELGIDNGEVAISVSIEGNPELYTPGKLYNVTITSSVNFDGFFLTGLYTLTSEARARMQGLGFFDNRGAGNNLMCSIVHSQVNPEPQHHLTFTWMAPASGTGCVSFLATGTLRNQLLFKDTTVLQMCEEGAPTTSPLRPELAILHGDGIIMRDDFDSSPDVNVLLWNEVVGANISSDCGHVMFGDSSWLCQRYGQRKLVTVPMNTSTAAVIQFALSAGRCEVNDSPDNEITVSYGLKGCTVWTVIDSIRLPSSLTEVHLVYLPKEARAEGVCLKWEQLSNTTTTTTEIIPVTTESMTTESTTSELPTTESTTTEPTTTERITTQPITTAAQTTHILTTTAKLTTTTEFVFRWDISDEGQPDFSSCWGIDNVLVVNTAERPTRLVENFDPIDPSNWLFFPGGNIRQKCRSEENSMFFNMENQTINFVVSRDLDLSVPDVTPDLMLEEQFESKRQPGWAISGGRVDVICGVLYHANSMVFDGAGARRACTPYLDTRLAGNLRFYFGFGSGRCQALDTWETNVYVYIEDSHAHKPVLLNLTSEDYKEPRLISLPINGHQRQSKARICWEQKHHRGVDLDVWAIDGVQVLPHFPRRSGVTKMVQFDLNLNCGTNTSRNNVDLEASTDFGKSWFNVHEPCLDSTCGGKHQPVTSEYESEDFINWKRVTSPLPFGALVPHVRFRWSGKNQQIPNWALDNVFVGDCEDGCHGNGQCTRTGCRCDFGYTGLTCDLPVVPHQTTMMEQFVDDSSLNTNNALHIKGASLSFRCGVLSSGKSLVFDKDGPRRLVTTDLNTTDDRYLQFFIRIGSNSVTSQCPPPRQQRESVMLDFSCDGGLTWELIKVFDDIREPQSDIVILPDEARGPACRFRWWQPFHSGEGRDLWAIDGISINNHLFNTINLDMANYQNDTRHVVAHLGTLSQSYCGSRPSISFIEPYQSREMRFIETKPVHVGPTYIVQFELVMACRNMYSMNRDNLLYLEYSTNHGLSWRLVEEPCFPPTTCQSYTEGTVYQPSKFQKWRQITVPMPPSSWGHIVSLRLRQSDWGPLDTWAVSRVYVGQHCPQHCSGNGRCEEGICRCDTGFTGASCQPRRRIEETMQADFGIRYEPDSDFVDIWGGEVTGGDKGCGTLLSGETLYFSDNGAREAQTKDLNTKNEDYIEFYLRIGGGLPDCSGGETTDEGVVLQYSTDGGNTWKLLRDMIPEKFRKPEFVHVVLPEDARSSMTRFRWWQPSHSGGGTDQWALDDIRVGHYERRRQIHDNFNTQLNAIDNGVWSTITEGILGKYCQNRDRALILANQQNDKYVVTKDLALETGDVIQFRVNVGCSNQFRWDHTVMLDYSHDGGQTWHLLEDPCYQENECDGRYTEGTMYYSGPHGSWQTVVIPVTEKLAMHPVMLRWWQQGGYPYNFGLDDVYVGPPCKENCHRNGVCEASNCVCDAGFQDPDCGYLATSPYGMSDWFDNHHEPSDVWRRIMGGKLGLGCGVVDYGNSLHFSGDGTREAVTVPVNTTYLRMLQFVLKIGGTGDGLSCITPSGRNEGVIVDYSTDNEVTWHVLKVVEPRVFNYSTERVTLELPHNAKTERTIFRWWQPLGYGGVHRAEWGLDSVIIGVNETNRESFQDDFAMMVPDPHHWLLTESAVPRITCNSVGNALEFSRDKDLRFAETMDFRITPSTFLQFDIAMACDSLYGALYGVMLEYSVDMGQTWHPVVHQCAPPNFQCSGYHLSSEYMSDQHKNWTRVTLYMPPGAVSPATRLRWKQQNKTPRGNVWALDNVYLGNGCPWLCSGHGYCREGACICDQGFGGPHCDPIQPLPMMLRDDFNGEVLNNRNWKEIYGGGPSDMCGIVVSGKALLFHKNHLRMVVSDDIDTQMLTGAEFYFKYGCNDKETDWPRAESVLFQYSTNGGIIWNLIKEIHYSDTSKVRFFSLELPDSAKSAAARFRFWQPENQGDMKSVWSVDNFYIGKMPASPSMMSDDFDSRTMSDSWLFINEGKVKNYCEHNTRQDTTNSGHSALVFGNTGSHGERYVETKDLSVGPMSELQFDINVGCESDPTEDYPVRVEYSPNGGKTWHALVSNCALTSTAWCFDVDTPATVYYGGTSKYWRRVIVPLDNVYICGSLRFRWYQGFIAEDHYAPEWAIDNVFIGMACMDYCQGHGACSDTMMCTCDQNRHGDSCVTSFQLPTHLSDDFERSDGQSPVRGQEIRDNDVNETKWWMQSGGEISNECGKLISGEALHFRHNGERMLVSTDLDFSTVSIIQFFIRLGCGRHSPDTSSFPVYLQFSTNAGVNWNSIEQFDFNKYSNVPKYYALHVPPEARTNSTRVRWWQPSVNGTFPEEWAIDQVFIGGDMNGVTPLGDDENLPKETSWLVYPGATIEPVCNSPQKAIHFNGDTGIRYAMSGDVIVDEESFLQFEVAMGCVSNRECYNIGIEFSRDFGNTWELLQKPCLPSDVDCGRFYPGTTLVSDVHTGWHRVTIPLPYYSRGKAIRFRWIQPTGYGKKQNWAVSRLYIGKGCPLKCNGHGKCSEAGCICDDGWQGFNCSEPVLSLPTYLYDSFDPDINGSQWLKVVGAQTLPPCKVMAAGNALHFSGGCSRILISRDLDLRHAVYVQFVFLFGCTAGPVTRNQGVLVDYSTDGGITWMPITELYYTLYRTPKFLSLKLPEKAKDNGVRLRWWQPLHGGHPMGDWSIDNIRIGGDDSNPTEFMSDFSGPLDYQSWMRDDNMAGDSTYCNEAHVAHGTTQTKENSVLETREVGIENDFILEYELNVGCGQTFNKSSSPVHLEYSTDNGVTWSHLSPQCLPKDPECNGGLHMGSVYHSEPMGMWRRFTHTLSGLPVSNSTRFRWTQKADGNVGPSHEWGIREVYVGRACSEHCNGHGRCRYPSCTCDQGYSGSYCLYDRFPNPTYLKDNFESSSFDKSKWSLVEGGELGKPCENLAEGSAAVFTGSNYRQLVTIDLDLRNTRFVQFIGSLGGVDVDPTCFTPRSPEHSVILQYSNNGGITWEDLHVMDFTTYKRPRQEYVLLPQSARTKNTRLRWWQPLNGKWAQTGPQWAIDNVLIGGNEINPSHMQVSFDDSVQSDAPWEFNPHGEIKDNVCTKGDSSIVWEEGRGNRSFTTGQLIVQEGFMLQFKIAVGCSGVADNCADYAPVYLEYNKDPGSARWDLVRPLCLPDHAYLSECQPRHYHSASVFTHHTHPSWTLVTIPLTEKTFSSTTRFRWIQDTQSSVGISWALDDIYVGESCPDLCHSRGTCLNGKCFCERGYFGKKCLPQPGSLIRTMYDSFEGGIFSFYWESVSGGGIGFGCGSLRPFAHGKTLYFNGCGHREARTVEMDLRSAKKLMFVLQIGCPDQTSTCNILSSNGSYSGVLLQYTINKGAEWKLLARHDAEEYLLPKRAAYDLPDDAKKDGVQFRWWQPVHRKTGYDQWAIDQVEVIQDHNAHNNRFISRSNG